MEGWIEGWGGKFSGWQGVCVGGRQEQRKKSERVRSTWWRGWMVVAARADAMELFLKNKKNIYI